MLSAAGNKPEKGRRGREPERGREDLTASAAGSVLPPRGCPGDPEEGGPEGSWGHPQPPGVSAGALDHSRGGGGAGLGMQSPDPSQALVQALSSAGSTSSAHETPHPPRPSQAASLGGHHASGQSFRSFPGFPRSPTARGYSITPAGPPETGRRAPMDRRRMNRNIWSSAEGGAVRKPQRIHKPAFQGPLLG